ncbi:Reverse transcriptase domain-containing protein [Raphanus sativus]|nr:Reverse transcriptase domain-containing protein [Raphanus sativus]
MKLDISVSGEIKQVELEYEDLQKHCFICFSLAHDKDDCPSQRAQANYREPAPRMGISQNRTLERIEAERRKAEERKSARSDSLQWQRPATREFDWRQDKNFRYNYGARRDPHYKEDSSRREGSAPNSRLPAKERLSLTRNETISAKGSQSRQQFQTPRAEWRPVVSASNKGANSKEAMSLVSHTPSPHPQREGGVSSRGEISASRQSGGGTAPSQERLSALNRLSLPDERVPLLQNGMANPDSGRLQAEPSQVIEETVPIQIERSNPSSSRNPRPPSAYVYDGTQERSPIRTLSEDRLNSAT